MVPCPQCGLQLTKGDGCSSVNCVCGKSFDWNVELKKVHTSLACSFMKEHKGKSADEIADFAALIKYHGGPPPPTHGTSDNSDKNSDDNNDGDNSNSSNGDNNRKTIVSGGASDEEMDNEGTKSSFLSNVVNYVKKSIGGDGGTSSLSSQSPQTTSALSKPPKTDIGIYVRASAWSTLNRNALGPAQARLFEKLVILSHFLLHFLSPFLSLYSYYFLFVAISV